MTKADPLPGAPPESPAFGERHRLARVALDWQSPSGSGLQGADRDRLVADLEADNRFALPDRDGPYALHLSIQAGRLVFDVRAADGGAILVLGLASGPFRKLVKDYALLVDSYQMAVAEGRQARIQAIDMGRRALHDEGGALVMERLDGRVVVDLNTARRLFSLLYAMMQR